MRAELEVHESPKLERDINRAAGEANIIGFTDSIKAHDIFWFGLYHLRNSPCFDWVCAELRAEMEAWRQKQPKPPPPPDPYEGWSPEDRAKAEDYNKQAQRLKWPNLLDRPPPNFAAAEEVVRTPEEEAASDAAFHADRAHRKSLHGDLGRDYLYVFDLPVTPEELESFTLENYLARGWQLAALSGRPDLIGPHIWGSMPSSELDALKTVFPKYLEYATRNIRKRDPVRVEGVEAAFATLMRRALLYWDDPYKRWPNPSTEEFTKLSFDVRFDFLGGVPMYVAALTRDLVLLRWRHLIGTPFEHVPDQPLVPLKKSGYPPAILKSVAEGYLPGDLTRIRRPGSYEFDYKLPEI